MHTRFSSAADGLCHCSSNLSNACGVTYSRNTYCMSMGRHARSTVLLSQDTCSVHGHYAVHEPAAGWMSPHGLPSTLIFPSAADFRDTLRACDQPSRIYAHFSRTRLIITVWIDNPATAIARAYLVMLLSQFLPCMPSPECAVLMHSLSTGHEHRRGHNNFLQHLWSLFHMLCVTITDLSAGRHVGPAWEEQASVSC